MRATHFRSGHFDAAAKAIGQPGLHPHELRHTAANLAIASGADVKVVQQMLGHSSATMTLDTYGHLFENRLDEVGSALDLARRAVDLPVRRKAHGETPPNPAVAQTLPNEGVIDLATYRTKEKPQVSLRFRMAPPEGFEPSLPPPEGGALSPELRGLVRRG